MRSSLVWMRSSLIWMRSSLVVRASDCQCTSCNGLGFDPSIRRHSGICGAADEAVLNNVRTKRKKSPKKIFKKKKYSLHCIEACRDSDNHSQLASSLVRAPVCRLGGHLFDYTVGSYKQYVGPVGIQYFQCTVAGRSFATNTMRSMQ